MLTLMVWITLWAKSLKPQWGPEGPDTQSSIYLVPNYKVPSHKWNEWIAGVTLKRQSYIRKKHIGYIKESSKYNV